jgi:hypothetical protein
MMYLGVMGWRDYLGHPAVVVLVVLISMAAQWLFQATLFKIIEN